MLCFKKESSFNQVLSFHLALSLCLSLSLSLSLVANQKRAVTFSAIHTEAESFYSNYDSRVGLEKWSIKRVIFN